ncbi:MAG: sulfur carrier protein ThiS [Nitrospirae bacterium]|nr:sulfur carrier protein ThiS [Nitrospirota bacterium]
MRLRINGKNEETEAATILEILNARNVEPRMVAVEVNSKMIGRDDYAVTKLKEGDEIEFLYFMGGGLI